MRKTFSEPSATFNNADGLYDLPYHFLTLKLRHGWLHRMLDAPPTLDKTMVAPKWGVEFTENLTGSPKGIFLNFAAE